MPPPILHELATLLDKVRRGQVLSTQGGRHAGGSADIVPGAGEKSIISAHGDDDQPRLVTLSWSVDPWNGGERAALAPGNSFGVVGLLSWGVGGVVHNAEFDWGRGGLATVVATGFHLRARYRQGVTTGPTLSVRASASYDAKPGQEINRVTLTRPFSVTTNLTLPVPNMARFVTTFAVNDAAMRAGNLVLELLDLDGTKVYEHTPSGSTMNLALELPNNAWFVRLVHSGVGTITGALLFHLSL